VLADVHLEGTVDTTVTVNATLDEDSTVYVVVVPYPSVKPTTLQVSRGQLTGSHVYYQRVLCILHLWQHCRIE
jgi:hypothetical protein